MTLRQELESILLAHRPQHGQNVIDDDGELAFEDSGMILCSCNPAGPSSGFADYHEWARHVAKLIDDLYRPPLVKQLDSWKLVVLDHPVP